MVFFAGLMLWAYPVTEYKAITAENEGQCTSPWKAFGQALNFWDFITEASAVYVCIFCYNHRLTSRVIDLERRHFPNQLVSKQEGN